MRISQRSWLFINIMNVKDFTHELNYGLCFVEGSGRNYKEQNIKCKELQSRYCEAVNISMFLRIPHKPQGHLETEQRVLQE